MSGKWTPGPWVDGYSNIYSKTYGKILFAEAHTGVWIEYKSRSDMSLILHSPDIADALLEAWDCFSSAKVLMRDIQSQLIEEIIRDISVAFDECGIDPSSIKTAWTKGPWFLAYGGHDMEQRVETPREDWVFWASYDCDGVECLKFEKDTDRAIIAASPVMAGALKRCLSYVEQCDVGTLGAFSWAPKARSMLNALAKAKGEGA